MVRQWFDMRALLTGTSDLVDLTELGDFNILDVHFLPCVVLLDSLFVSLKMVLD